MELRVLHISGGYGGGISSLIKNLAVEMPAWEITFDVICFQDSFRAFLEKTGEEAFRMKIRNRKTFRRFAPVSVSHFLAMPMMWCTVTCQGACSSVLCADKALSCAALFNSCPWGDSIWLSGLKTSVKMAIDGWVNRHF